MTQKKAHPFSLSEKMRKVESSYSIPTPEDEERVARVLLKNDALDLAPLLAFPSLRAITVLVQAQVDAADCSRRKVGCVLSRDGVVVGQGHNELPEGSCEAGACPRGRMTYEEQPADVDYETSGCVSIHAEDMALAEAGPRAKGATAYISEPPCPRCVLRLKAAGVKEVVRVEIPQVILSESSSDTKVAV